MRFALILAALLAGLCGACSSTTQPVEYTPPEGGFTVTFPTNHGSKDKIVENKQDLGIVIYSSSLNDELDDKGRPKSCTDCPEYVVIVTADLNPKTPLHLFDDCTNDAHARGKTQTKQLGSEPAVQANCMIDGIGERHVIVVRHGDNRYAVLTNRVGRDKAEDFFESFRFAP